MDRTSSTTTHEVTAHSGRKPPTGGLKRRIGKYVPGEVRLGAQLVRNTIMRWTAQPDYKRWCSSQGLQEWWDERTRLIAGLAPAGSKVIEFGAGRRQLERVLPAGCCYIPSDLVDRGPGTVVCDLNARPLPDLAAVAPQVAVFGGVLEYLHDVPAIVQWLSASGIQTCIASFDPFPARLGIVGRWREWTRRCSNGYMCNLTEQEFLSAFEAAGFVPLRKRTWRTQSVFQFARQS
jgi:hypothetical protein